MLGQPELALYSLSMYHNDKVLSRNQEIAKTIRSICTIVREILKEAEAQEQRFSSTLVEDKDTGRFLGVNVISANEFEITLYLNQMGVFNFLDDPNMHMPGHGVLKLSDGRKRSMSLWVEFITASGYLSARKIRARFQSLVAEAVEKSPYRDSVKLLDSSEVKLRVHDKWVVQLTPTFRCTAVWPRSASFWPMNAATINWPRPEVVAEIKAHGFDLLSKESPVVLPKQQQNQNSATSSVEGDAWWMSFTNAEDILLSTGCRRKVFSILKTLRDAHLDFANSPVTNYIVKTLILFECEKHPYDAKWTDLEMGDRVVGVLLQLVSCLQCRRCPHYFIPNIDLLRGKPSELLDESAKVVWGLVRNLIINPRTLEQL